MDSADLVFKLILGHLRWALHQLGDAHVEMRQCIFGIFLNRFLEKNLKFISVSKSTENSRTFAEVSEIDGFQQIIIEIDAAFFKTAHMFIIIIINDLIANLPQIIYVNCALGTMT